MLVTLQITILRKESSLSTPRVDQERREAHRPILAVISVGWRQRVMLRCWTLLIRMFTRLMRTDKNSKYRLPKWISWGLKAILIYQVPLTTISMARIRVWAADVVSQDPLKDSTTAQVAPRPNPSAPNPRSASANQCPKSLTSLLPVDPQPRSKVPP